MFNLSSNVRIRRRLLAGAVSVAVALPGLALSGGASPVGAQSPDEPVPSLGKSSEVLGALPGGLDDLITGDPLATGAQFARAYGQTVLPEGGALGNERAEPALHGGHTVRLDQTINGLPVFGSGVVVRLDTNGSMLSMSSELSDQAVPATPPTIAFEDAIAAAIADTAAAESAPAEQLVPAGDPALVVYDPNLIGGDLNAGQPSRVVWDVNVTNQRVDHPIRRRVLVNATSGAVDLSFTEVVAAKDRRISDCKYQPITESTDPCTLARSEGEPKVGLTEVDTTYEMMNVAYEFYNQQFARDSFNNKGAPIKAYARFCSPADGCPTQNAFWSDGIIYFGEHFEQAEDIAVHEFTHAVIEHTANMMYYAESGAINESFADVFGEIADRWYRPDTQPGSDAGEANWLIGEDLSRFFNIPGGAARSMRNPTLFDDPDKMTSELYWSSKDDHYGVHHNSGVNNKAAFLIAAGGSFNGYTIEGIGLVKTAAVYYEALTGLMTPGTDYGDLYKILPRACKNLVGKHVGPNDNVGPVTETNCASVQKAVNATEMNKRGHGAGAGAPVCDSFSRRDLFTDDFENGGGKWTTRSNLPERWNWSISKAAAESGSRSARAPQPPQNHKTDPTPPDFKLITADPVYIPRGSDSYLRFKHSFKFDWAKGFGAADGGVVEYATSRNGPWKDLGSRADHHGYNETITLDSQPDRYLNPLGVRDVFGNESPGFQVTRIPLAEFGGKELFFRFRYGAEPFDINGLGWFVDDVAVYDCPDPANTPIATVAGFRSISPKRLFDTRADQPQGVRKVAKGQRAAESVLTVDVNGIPGAFASTNAISLNVTAVNTGGPGFVTVYPCGTKRPATSSVNFSGAGQFSANGLIVPVSRTGKLCFYTKTGTDLFADVNGYFTKTSGFRPRVPARMFDTRGHAADHLTELSSYGKIGGKRKVKITIDNAKRIAALVLNATATNTTGPGFVRAYPCATGQPDSSNVNFTGANQTVANGVVAPDDKNGALCFASNTKTDLAVDLNGIFLRRRSFHPIAPERLFDSRRGESGKVSVPNGKVGTNGSQVLTVDMSKYGKVPKRAKAAVLNVTTVGANSPGFVTVYPCGTRPQASNVNFLPNQVVANSVIAPISGKQKVCFYASANTHIVADISGFLTTR